MMEAVIRWSSMDCGTFLINLPRKESRNVKSGDLLLLIPLCQFVLWILQQKTEIYLSAIPYAERFFSHDILRRPWPHHQGTTPFIGQSLQSTNQVASSYARVIRFACSTLEHSIGELKMMVQSENYKNFCLKFGVWYRR